MWKCKKNKKYIDNKKKTNKLLLAFVVQWKYQNECIPLLYMRVKDKIISSMICFY